MRSEFGDDAHIVAANRVRKGGVGGFFAREFYEVIVEEPDAPIDLRPPVRLGRQRRDDTAAYDSGRSVPLTVLDLVEERNEEERLLGAINLGLDSIQIIDDDDEPIEGPLDDPFGGHFAGRAAAGTQPTTWAHSQDIPVEAVPVVVPEPPAPQVAPAPASTPAMAAPAMAIESQPVVSTETERFAQILERLAHSTEHQPSHYEPGTTQPAPQPTFATTTDPAPMREPAPAPEAQPRVISLVDAERVVRAEPVPRVVPGAPVARPTVATAPPAHATAPTAASTADPARSGAEDIIERPEQMLVRLGLPARFVPRGMTGNALRDALVESLGRLPRAEELPKAKGVVVAIVGLGAGPVLLGRSVSEALGLDPEEVVVATQNEIDGVPAWLQITEPDAADERRRSWRRRDQLTFVAISQPSLTTGTAWASDMLDRLEPTQLWGLAAAGWKPEDVDAWSRRLGGFDMVCLDRLVDTVSPASMLSLGLPIGRLDGADATPQRWADLLLDRISTAEPARAGSAA